METGDSSTPIVHSATIGSLNDNRQQDHPERLRSEVVVLMGVSGVGKSTIGKALAERLGWSFVDGDDLHPAANVAKMKRGEPLTDADRLPWLQRLHAVIADYRSQHQPLVLACSALRASYRRILVGDEPDVRFVYLTGDPDLIASRLGRRTRHFMPLSLLPDQLSELESPSGAMKLDVRQPVTTIVQTIIDKLGL
jgi:carbohydrate kinase (thermoresistant glucokinase family)